MRSIDKTSTVTKTPAIEVQIEGPDSTPLPAAVLRRLFPGSALTQSRLDRLRGWPRLVVTCGDTVVALATCQKTEAELRVPEIGLDADGLCTDREAVDALLDAIELAGLAAGCRRIVVMPPRISPIFFERRGYIGMTERCGGAWLQKLLD